MVTLVDGLEPQQEGRDSIGSGRAPLLPRLGGLVVGVSVDSAFSGIVAVTDGVMLDDSGG
jgi:hypothetical protein